MKALQRETKAPRKRAGTRKAKSPAATRASASQGKSGSARATTRAAEPQPTEEEEGLDHGLADELDDLASELEEAARLSDNTNSKTLPKREWRNHWGKVRVASGEQTSLSSFLP